MNNSIASYILSCYTNDQLAAVHNYFELEIEDVKRTGWKATLFYKDQTYIRSLSVPYLILQPGGIGQVYVSPCGHNSGDANKINHCGWFPCVPCNEHLSKQKETH